MSTALLAPKTRQLTAAELGFNAAATNASITGNTIDVSRYNCLTLFCEFTRSAATGTITLAVDVKGPITDNFCVMQTSATSTGVVTFSDMSLAKATGSASLNYEIRLTNLDFHQLRIKMASAITNATASDTLTITGELSFQP